ncbi:MAG: hydrogenase formation protein HypD [Chloroflexota bacterium]|nr:hydrogenase formation protein HypD [Chloroflexota bacterium]
MRFIDEYRNAEIGKPLIERISQRSRKPTRLMEFCGGHTVSILKHGIRQLLPGNIEMLSGPGCPVCVTSNSELDKAIALSEIPRVTIATFGDMIRVPGTHTSLQKAKAGGADVRVVYSTTDALQIARDNPLRSVVFVGIGFETTAPTVAASILTAKEQRITNYFVLCMHKLCPPVMRALLDSGEVCLDGIVCPGHVSAVIGSMPYEFIPANYGIACVVSGFEPLDILLAVDMLVDQVEAHMPKVEIAYRRGVKEGGNRRALQLIEEVFEVSDGEWRGIGTIPGSGLRLRDKYRSFDAAEMFDIPIRSSVEPKECLCGDILRGVKLPSDCTLFRKGCTPAHPIGPCMVSSEGSCAAYYEYGES